MVVEPSIYEVTMTSIFMESLKQPSQSLPQESAMKKFSATFQRWYPQGIVGATPTDKAMLDLLFANPPTTTHSTSTCYRTPSNYDIVKQTIQLHQHRIGNIVQDFNCYSTKGTVDIKYLQAAFAAVESSTWTSYKTYCDQQQTALAEAVAEAADALEAASKAATEAEEKQALAEAASEAATEATTKAALVAALGAEDAATEAADAAELAAVASSIVATKAAAKAKVIAEVAAALVRDKNQIHQMIESELLPLLLIDTITNAIDKFKQLKQTLKHYTHACYRGKSYYLGDYNFAGGIDLTEKFTTTALQQQLNSIQGVIGEDPDFLYWYEYFTDHTSMLFTK